MILLWLKHRYHNLLTAESGIGVMVWVGVVGATIASVFNFTNVKSSVQQQHKKFRSMSMGETVVYDVGHAIKELIEDHAVSSTQNTCNQLIRSISNMSDIDNKTNHELTSYNYNSTDSTNTYPGCLHVNKNNPLYREIETLETQIIINKETQNPPMRHILVKVTGSRKDGGTIDGEFEFNVTLATVQQHLGFIFFNPDTTPLITINGASPSDKVEVTFKSPVLLHDTDKKIESLKHVIKSDITTSWDTSKLIFQDKFMTTLDFFNIRDAQSIGISQSIFTQGILTRKFKGKDFKDYLPAAIPVEYEQPSPNNPPLPPLQWDDPQPIGFSNFINNNSSSNETLTIPDTTCDKNPPPVLITNQEVTIDLTSSSVFEFCALIKTTDKLIIQGLTADNDYQFYGSFIAKQLELRGSWSSSNSNETRIEFNLAAEHREFSSNLSRAPLGQFFNMPLIEKNQWIASPNKINNRFSDSYSVACDLKNDTTPPKFLVATSNCFSPDLDDPDEWTNPKMKKHIFFVQ